METGEVQIWQINLNLPRHITGVFRKVLTENEKQKADRYYFEVDKNRFTICRWALRTLLGHYLNLVPESIEFLYTEYQKPYINPNQNPDNLHFNLSHAHAEAIFAFTHDSRIGIDIEDIKDMEDIEHIASNYFSMDEVMAFKSTPIQYKKEAFFKCWTLKESYIKAIGEGLSCPLDQFSVDFPNDTHPALLSAKWDEKETERWRMYRLQTADGYLAALSVEGKDHQIVYKDFKTLMKEQKSLIF